MTKNVPHFTDSMVYSIEQIAIYLEIHGKNFFSQITNGELTPEEFRTIDVILCNPNICQRDLAKLILRDRVRTGRILDALEAKGLIRRFGDMKNKRLVKKMELTEKGNKYFQDITKRVQPYLVTLCEKFSDKQIVELKKLLNSLKEVLAEIVKVPV